MPPRSTALLGLGANIGEPEAQLAAAVRGLARRVTVEALSSVYLTEPVGGPEQPPYLNLVAKIGTDLAPGELLSLTRDIEDRLGRARRLPNEPRTIDIDILAFDDLVRSDERLTIPHPRMHTRGFVLYPLDEIAPEWRHPLLGLTAREMMIDAAGELERVERLGPLALDGESPGEVADG